MTTSVETTAMGDPRDPGRGGSSSSVGPLYQLPELRYGYGDLAPVIDEPTMRLHHDKHHRAYVDGINAALAAAPQWRGLSIEELLRCLRDLPAEIRETVRNQGGGHANHSLFWECLTPRPMESPHGELVYRIKTAFGSTDAFRRSFEQAGARQFGSGWVFLVADPEANLEIVSLPNQDSVLSQGQSPLFACDVWEHAYYLKYNNRRSDWLSAWWQVVDWESASGRFEASLRPAATSDWRAG